MTIEHDKQTRYAAPLAAILGLALACVVGACGGSQQQEPAPVYPEDPPPVGERSAAPEPAPAPETEPAPEAAPAATDTGEFTDDEIRTFAHAYAGVMEVQVRYQERLQEASSDEDLRAIEAEGNAEIQQVVSDHGMTLDEFESIAQAAATDEEVRARVDAEIQGLQHQ